MGRLDCRALIIDDLESSRDMANFFVLHHGWTTSQVADPEQAMSLIAAEGEFDLLILDWRMPHMSGRETLQQLDKILTAQNPHGAKIAVMVYTNCELNLIDLPICNRILVKGIVSKKGSPFSQSKSFDRIIKELSNQKTKEIRAMTAV